MFVITGPSGVGKGTLIGGLLYARPEIELSISATTRPPRRGEQDGRDYYFLTPKQFDAKVANGEFLESATYIGNRYGTLRSEIDRRLGRDKSVVLEIEIQGARQIRESMPEAEQIFIKPPSNEELRRRLIDRGTDTPEQVDARMSTAKAELSAEKEFDNVVVNETVDRAVAELSDLVDESLDRH